MKTCHIYPVSADRGMYQWKWKCVDGKRKAVSSRAFSLFYDCVEDARSHGAKIDLDRVHQEFAAVNVNTKLVTASPKSARQ